MTTVLSKKGQIVLPSSVREQMSLEPGQDFEIFMEDEDTHRHKLIVVTRNVQDFQNTGVKILNPFTA